MVLALLVVGWVSLPAHGAEGVLPREGATQNAVPDHVLGDLSPATGWQVLPPRRDKLPPNPYGQTDFTAYTLEWGEAKLGLINISVGALPRLQIGTSPVLDALGAVNGNVKIDALRVGRLDMALLADRYDLRLDEFHGSWTGAGLRSSVILTRAWSVHASGEYSYVRSRGLPDRSRLSPLLGSSVERYPQEYYEEHLDVDIDAHTVTVRLASDVRFNRRDSLVLQGRTMVWRDLALGESWDKLDPDEIPPIMGLEQVLPDSDEEGRTSPVGRWWSASVAYHMAFQRWDLRFGVGFSQPRWFDWVLPAFDLAYRWGGPTRTNEERMKEAWRAARAERDEAEERTGTN